MWLHSGMHFEPTRRIIQFPYSYSASSSVPAAQWESDHMHIYVLGTIHSKHGTEVLSSQLDENFCESSKLGRAFAHDREWRKRLKLNSKFRLGFRQCRVSWSFTHKSSVSACKFIWLGGRVSVLSINLSSGKKETTRNSWHLLWHREQESATSSSANLDNGQEDVLGHASNTRQWQRHCHMYSLSDWHVRPIGRSTPKAI